MSTQMKRKVARTANARGIKRTTISIECGVHALGLQLARMDRRDFSNQVEALIEAEARRRNVEVAA
jgi:hypothetical protein